MNDSHRPLEGIVPPIVTPLVDRDTLDVWGLERLIEHLLTGGVAGLFVLGTTGEGPHLSYRLRREVVTETCRLVQGRVPVMVGITDASVAESLGMASHASKVGADYLVMAPPFYLPCTQAELASYVERITPGLPLPVFLYHLPALTKVPYEIETLRRLIALPKIAGVKDSSGNMSYFHRLATLARQRPDWSLLIGTEELLDDAIRAGGHGGVTGGANLFPGLYVALHQAAKAGDFPRVRLLKDTVLDISERLYHFGGAEGTPIRAIKRGLRFLGICDDVMTEPLSRFPDAEGLLVDEIVGEIAALMPVVSRPEARAISDAK